MSLSLLQLPQKITLDQDSYSSSYGKFVIQPLERGYGTTVGNALRRVLISSIPGYAFKAIKIDNVLHEYSTIEGVREDVTEIILNLKQVRIKLLNDRVNKISLKLKGPGEFTAAEIQKQSPDIQVLNPETHIATLGKSANFSMELWVGFGIGYVPAEENKSPEFSIGVIPIDAIYTPIKNVNYIVETIRWENRDNLERLTLEVTTDGSITPEESLKTAANILREHFEFFTTFKIEDKSAAEKQKDPEKERIRKILKRSIEELELSVRATNSLRGANITTVADLVRREESELLRFRNFGRKSLDEIKEKIQELGLQFGMDVDKYLENE
ncbi:MAG: DNA-directed RNA polymerase subunit alpha [Ignavibacteria bacterium]|nr:DNA-directed RNA polymerase subunit alpha [Ignavibacteria bacterium]